MKRWAVRIGDGVDSERRQDPRGEYSRYDGVVGLKSSTPYSGSTR